MHDAAYKGGDLLLSDAAQHIEQTFCNSCYKGIISAGGGSGKPEHDILRELLSKGVGANLTASVDDWNRGHPVTSPFVIGYHEGQKQEAVPGIIQWYAEKAHVTIPNEQVYFYDDKAVNIKPFTGKGFNARQISCSSRDGVLGRCGATVSDIVNTKGVQLCSQQDAIVV